MENKFGTIGLAITIASFFAWPMGSAFAQTFEVKGVNCEAPASLPIIEYVTHVNHTTTLRIITVQITKDGCNPKDQSGSYQMKIVTSAFGNPGCGDIGSFGPCPTPEFNIQSMLSDSPTDIDDVTHMIRRVSRVGMNVKGTGSVTAEIPPSGGMAYVIFSAGELASGTFDYEYTIH